MVDASSWSVKNFLARLENGIAWGVKRGLRKAFMEPAVHVTVTFTDDECGDLTKLDETNLSRCLQNHRRIS